MSKPFLQPSHEVIRSNISPYRSALLISGTYAVASIAYIFISSYFAKYIAATSVATQLKIEIFKGSAFVLLSSLLIFALVYILTKKNSVFQNQMLLMEKYRMIALTSSLVGHDINNALSVASISLEMMKGEGESQDLSEYGQNIQKALSQAHELARSLSSSAKNPATLFEEFDPNSLLDAAINLIRKHPVALQCQVKYMPCESRAIRANKLVLEQAVINLIINAAAAAGKKGVVEVYTSKYGPEFKIEVHDNGPGIPVEKRKEIFAPFYTTKPQGTGLGLLSVEMCARMHNGSVSIRDSHLGGALFEIILGAVPAKA